MSVISAGEEEEDHGSFGKHMDRTVVEIQFGNTKTTVANYESKD